MKDPLKIVIYFFVVIIGAAILAPPLFWAGTTIGDAWGIRQFSTSNFARYFNRAILISAVLAFVPLLISLRVRSLRELGLRKNPRWLADGGVGLGIGFGGFFVLAMGLFVCGWSDWRETPEWHRLWNVVATAVVVSLIEEFAFRGGIQGIVLRHARPGFAIGFTAALFSIVHFVKPPNSAQFGRDDVTWTSGFELLPTCFAGFADPMLLLAGFTTLLVAGWILGYATWRTGSLAVAIGLHAGWILAVEGFKRLADRPLEHLPWIGGDLLTGLLPLVLLALSAFLVWLYVKGRGEHEETDHRSESLG